MLNFEINKFLNKKYLIIYKYSFQNLFSFFNVLMIITSSSSNRRPCNSRCMIISISKFYSKNILTWKMQKLYNLTLQISTRNLCKMKENYIFFMQKKVFFVSVKKKIFCLREIIAPVKRARRVPNNKVQLTVFFFLCEM